MKKQSLIQLGCLALVLVVFTALAANYAQQRRQTQTQVAGTDIDLPAAPTTATEDDTLAAKTRTTVVYYQDDYGYLVPVSRKLPEQEGIARATLSLLVKTPDNDLEAARLGLRTLLPEGTTFTLDISKDGLAKLDLSKHANAMPDAASENSMVAGIVQTLTEFPTVKQVQLTINGKKLEALKHGTAIGKPLSRNSINLEATEPTGMFDAEKVQLYFPGEDGRVLVPVTRAVFGRADVSTAVLELAKGPRATSPLNGALPTDCGIIGVNTKDGVATINFTGEFMRIAEQSDGGRLALKALVLTCTQFKGVKEVRVQVDGKAYDPGTSTLSVPTFINDADTIVEQFVETRSASLYTFD